MTHDEIEFLIVQRLDGTLSAEEARVLDAALASDPAARALLASHEKLATALRALPPAPAVDGDWFAARIAAQIDDDEAIRAAQRSYRLPRIAVWGPLAAAAGLLITLTLGVVFHRDDGEPIATANPATNVESFVASTAVARVTLPAARPSAASMGTMTISVGAPSNLSPQLVTALFLAEQLPSPGRVIVRPAGPHGETAFD